MQKTIKAQISGSLLAQYTYFYDIITDHNGGAICDSQSAGTFIEHCIFEKVETEGEYNGGAIYKKEGNLSVSFCCFFWCSSGNKNEGNGGNAFFFTGSSNNCTAEYSVIARSSGDSASSNTGDASLYVRPGKEALFNLLNGTRNFARFDDGGNLLVELSSFKIIRIKYCHISDSKGTRVAADGGDTPSKEISHCNIINNSMYYFIKDFDKIEDCYIFGNTITNTKKYNFVDCKSDDPNICNPPVVLTTIRLHLIMEFECLNFNFFADETNFKLKPVVVIIMHLFINSLPNPVSVNAFHELIS